MPFAKLAIYNNTTDIYKNENIKLIVLLQSNFTMDGFSEMPAEYLCNAGPLVMGNLPTEEIFYWEFELDEHGQFKPDKNGVIIYANINNTTLKYIYFDPNREGLRVLTPYKAN